jgi:hypothetical protein
VGGSESARSCIIKKGALTGVCAVGNPSPCTLLYNTRSRPFSGGGGPPPPPRPRPRPRARPKARSHIIEKGAWTGVCAVGNMLGYIWYTAKPRMGTMMPYYIVYVYQE